MKIKYSQIFLNVNLNIKRILILKTKIMNKYIARTSLFLLMLVSFTSCEVVEGIFKLGMGVGVFIVIAILAVVIYVFAKLTKK